MISLISDLVYRVREAIDNAEAAGALTDVGHPEITVARVGNPSLADYSTPVAMQLSRIVGIKPDKIARVLALHFPDTNYLSKVEQVGGYLNFRLGDTWLQQQVDQILANGGLAGLAKLHSGQKAQVECVSANPTGPITVGRIRGGVIGDTLLRLLRAVGYETQMEYYFNDAGAQIDKLAESVRARYRERLNKSGEFPDGGYEGQYISDLADEFIQTFGDSLANATSNAPFREFAVDRIQKAQRVSLMRVGIQFDNYFSEQSLYADKSIDVVLTELREKGLVYVAREPEKDLDYDARPDDEDRDAIVTGEATWIRMRSLRDVKKDCALIKSTGEPTYRLPDIAYHINKLKRGFDIAINILGADHIEEAKDVIAAVAGLGYPAERIHYVIHQFVTLKRGGVVERMRTRKGEYVTLDELVDEVGSDAVRYFLLARSTDSHVEFDLELARKQSNENPVFYVQNAFVRCVSIARVAAEKGIDWSDGDVALLADPRELAIIRRLVELPDIVLKATEEFAPHRVAFWAHEDLARTFHQTYEDVRAIHGDVPIEVSKARLKLFEATRIVLSQVLGLMGMTAPESM